MSIEEAEYILSEAIITEPSINSYTYISAEEINQAIDKILEERLVNEIKIKELEKNKYPNEVCSNKKLMGIIKYVKKLVKSVFDLKIKQI